MTRFAWQPGFVVWHHVAVKPPHKRSCWWHRPTGTWQESVSSTDNPFCAWNQQSLTAGTWSEAFSIYPTTWQDPGSVLQQLCIPAALFSLPCEGIPVQCRPGCSWIRMFVARACMIKLGPADQGLSRCLCPYFNSNNKSTYFKSSWDSCEQLESFSTEAKSFRPNVWRFLWADCAPLLVTREAAAGLD